MLTITKMQLNTCGAAPGALWLEKWLQCLRRDFKTLVSWEVSACPTDKKERKIPHLSHNYWVRFIVCVLWRTRGSRSAAHKDQFQILIKGWDSWWAAHTPSLGAVREPEAAPDQHSCAWSAAPFQKWRLVPQGQWYEWRQRINTTS